MEPTTLLNSTVVGECEQSIRIIYHVLREHTGEHNQRTQDTLEGFVKVETDLPGSQPLNFNERSIIAGDLSEVLFPSD